MRNWFINLDDGRLRAGWRILIFLLIFAALSNAGAQGMRAILGSLPRTSTLVLVILAVAATIAVYVARRWLDRKSFPSLGLTDPRAAARDVSFGFVLSGLMAGIVFALMIWLGLIENVELNWGNTPDAVGATVLLMFLIPTVFIGYWEELVFRGYLLQNMRDGMGLKWAVLLSCIIYGAAHAANPNATIASSLIIVLFGYLRIYGYVATRLLWLSIGMHIGWNFFQSPVFGYAASGHIENRTLFTHDAAGADWLSGGSFGPEGSVLIIPILLLALLAMRYWAQHFYAKQTTE